MRMWKPFLIVPQEPVYMSLLHFMNGPIIKIIVKNSKIGACKAGVNESVQSRSFHGVEANMDNYGISFV